MGWESGLARGIPLAASAMAAALVLAACDGGGGIDAESPSVGAMLELVPAAAHTEHPLMVNIYSRAAEQLELDVPAADAPADAVDDYYRQLYANETDAAAMLPSDLAPFGEQIGDVRDEFGFAPQAMTADIHAGAPPTIAMAAVGEFSADEISAATTASLGADTVTSEEVDGVPVVRWLDDNAQDLEGQHAFSRIGQSGRLGVANDHALLYATTDAVIDDLVAAYRGEAETLADNEDLVRIAEVLDDHEVRAAALSDTPFAAQPEQLSPEQLEAMGASGEGIGQYRAIGVGITGGPSEAAQALVAGGGMPATGVHTEPEDTGSRMVMAVIADDDADGLAERLEQVASEGSSWRGMPWADYLGDPSVDVDGSMVTATFSLKNTHLWRDLVFQGDTLVYPG